MRVRLFLDEDVIPELARILRARGFDAVSAHERGTLALSDEQQLVHATDDARAILTFNYVDYLSLGRAWHTAG